MDSSWTTSAASHEIGLSRSTKSPSSARRCSVLFALAGSDFSDKVVSIARWQKPAHWQKHPSVQVFAHEVKTHALHCVEGH